MVGGNLASDLDHFHENNMGLNGGRSGGGVWRWHLFGGPDIFLVLTEMALGRDQGLGEVLANQVRG